MNARLEKNGASLEKLLSTLPDLLISKGSPSAWITGIRFDSREVKPGDLFVALKGCHVDGHAYVQQAVARGASALVVEEPVEVDSAVPVVRVRSTRRALAKMAASFFDHPSERLVLVGITGTNGKTTTCHLVEGILKACGLQVGVLGTLGYRCPGMVKGAPMTTPESPVLQEMLWKMYTLGVTHVVMEVSSHALNMERIGGTFFDCAVFTNLSQDHLDFHTDMERYFEAKAKLFTRHLKPFEGSKTAVFNLDDDYGKRLAASFPGTYEGYSIDGTSGWTIGVRDAKLDAGGIHAQVRTSEGLLHISSPLVGRLNLSNILAAVGVGLALGMDKVSIQKGIQNVETVDGRLQKLEVPLDRDVVVDYAHTPDAMDKALACVAEWKRGRLWVVFGCGGDRDRSKRPAMGQVAARHADYVVLTSDNPRSEDPESIIDEIEEGVRAEGLQFFDPSRALPVPKGYVRESDRYRAIGMALSLSRPGDLVYIGGKGHERYQVFGTQPRPFDDRLVALEWARSLRRAGGT